MATLDDAAQSQARNIEQTTGRSIDDWVTLVRASGWRATARSGVAEGGARVQPRERQLRRIDREAGLGRRRRR